MFGYRPEREKNLSDWRDPFEQDTNGRSSETVLKPNECQERTFLSGTGWYVFFVRRVDQAIWYPYRQMGANVGKRNVCGSKHVALEILEGKEKELPYVWNFDESNYPFPDRTAKPADEA
jgi:hypothetical protein